MNKPKHPEAIRFYKNGLFANLNDFQELEKRISNLPQKDRGDAFEVFAEAYFATQPITQATDVIPEKAMSSVLKEKYVMEETDHGVDGIYYHKDNTVTAYQVKFRSRRVKLVWDELATFCGQSDRFNNRVIITNTDDVSEVAKKRANMNCITGIDLDRLDDRDFLRMNQWLGGNTITYNRKTPRKHQQEALDIIVPALRNADRSTAVMACGTGKTMVALWAMEQLQAKKLLVLLPSLALLRQTLHEWLKETNWTDLSYICVCSDTSVVSGADDILMNQMDLDFPVTTDSNVVKRFLAMSNGTKIVFSTYQSAPVVAAAVGDFQFDYAIFDEAHKTAGRDSANFSFALEDNNLAIGKRLFLTATPKHYSLRKDKNGDNIEVYSMNNKDVYGNIDYTLSFAEAAAQDIICNYKVLISVVTSEEVNEKMLKKGEVVLDGEVVNARHVASQIAFQKAVDKYGVNKVFTFHQSVKNADFFTSEGSAGIKTHLPNFDTFHVNGQMPTAKRERLIKDFANCKKGIMSNARCLTEGVDVPAVDMVAFMSPKKSKVDIIQAVGRAMRKSPGKTVGYILLPLFLEIEKDENIEDALARNSYEEIWDVLRALQEQDEEFAVIIKQLREEKGRTGSCPGTGLNERVEFLGYGIDLDKLRRVITTQCVEWLGNNWDEMYGRLLAYKERYGNCNISRYNHDDTQLANWVISQRRVYKNKIAGKLAEEKIKKLEAIGFSWDPHENLWNEMYNRLLDYNNRYGDCNVPQNYQDQQLARWIMVQRVVYKDGRMSEERIKQLENIAFQWSIIDWKGLYKKLIAYKEENGNCNVPYNYKDKQLAVWVVVQRRSYRGLGTSKLTKERIDLLNAIGFQWTIAEVIDWDEMYKELLAYKEQNGNCNIPYKRDNQLARWVVNQRNAYKKGNISKEKVQLLESIGFQWKPSEDAWNEMYNRLLLYKAEKGHCDIPSTYKEDKKLGKWASAQRKAYRGVGTAILTEERIKKLQEIGFEWNPAIGKRKK